VEQVLSVIGRYPTHTPVAFEAAFGWGWLAELLDDYGYQPHLVHPTRCKAIASARLKNDKVDAAILAQRVGAPAPSLWSESQSARRSCASSGTSSTSPSCVPTKVPAAGWAPARTVSIKSSRPGQKRGQ
jgi:hypothetical protein